MTLVLTGKDLVLEGSELKIEGKQVEFKGVKGPILPLPKTTRRLKCDKAIAPELPEKVTEAAFDHGN